MNNFEKYFTTGSEVVAIICVCIFFSPILITFITAGWIAHKFGYRGTSER